MAIVFTFDKLKLPPIADPKEMPSRVHQGLLNVAVNYNAALQLSDLIPVDQGTLAGSINASVSATAKEAFVGTSLIYGAVMEGGRQPGFFPPIDPIQAWVRRKIKPKPKKKKRKRRKKKGKIVRLKPLPKQTAKQKKAERNRLRAQKGQQVERFERSVAFAIAVKMFREGTAVPLLADGRGQMFQKTFDAERDRFPLWFVEGFSRV